MKPCAIAATVAALMPVGGAVALPPGDPPNSPPPGVPAPPAAWIDTAHGDHWLTPRDWRWCPPDGGGPCAMAPIASLTPAGACTARVLGEREEAAVNAGETVRIHFAFTPDTATLVLGRLVARLTPAQDMSWAVTGGTGGLLLRTHSGGSIVNHHVRLVIGDDTTPPQVDALGAVRVGDLVFLRVRTTERIRSTGCILSRRPATAVTPRGATFTRVRLPPATIPPGVGMIPMGPLPAGTVTVRFRLRDGTGNTTPLDARVRVTPTAVTLLR